MTFTREKKNKFLILAVHYHAYGVSNTYRSIILSKMCILILKSDGLCDLFWDAVPKPKTYCRRCPSPSPATSGLIQPHNNTAFKVPAAH